MNNSLTLKKCVPCEGKSSVLSEAEEDNYYSALNNWEIERQGIHKISKTISLTNFKAIINLVNRIANIAEEEGHHPNLHIHAYKKLTCELYTHAIGGLSVNDFIIASKIDEILNEKNNEYINKT